MSKKTKATSPDKQPSITAVVSIIVAVIGVIGTITVAYFQFVLPGKMSLEATRAAELKPTITPDGNTVKSGSTIVPSMPTPNTVDTQLPMPTTNSTPTPTAKVLIATENNMPAVPKSPTPTNTYVPTDTPVPSPTPTLSLTPTSTPSPTSASISLEFCVSVRSVYVRVEPSETTRSIGSLKFNDCLYFNARTQDSQWVRIASQQAEEFANITGGWVKSEFLRPIDFSNLPVYSWVDVPVNYLCVNVRSVYVREKPVEDSHTIGGLTYRDCLEFDGRTEDSSWVRIALGQDDYPHLRHGWVKSEFLVPQDHLQTLPIATPEPTPQG